MAGSDTRPKVYNQSSGHATQLIARTHRGSPSISDAQLAMAAGRISLTADYLRSDDEINRQRVIGALDEAYAALMAVLKDRLA